ncbi:hypothetical protein ACPA2L_19800 [Bacillus bombysepticus]
MIKKLISLLLVMGLLGGCTVSKENEKSNSNADKSNQMESPTEKQGDNNQHTPKQEKNNEDGNLDPSKKTERKEGEVLDIAPDELKKYEEQYEKKKGNGI